MKLWTTLSRKIILNHSPYLKVEEHAVELPDGRVIENWPWVITPDYVNVVAQTPDDAFVCFRQTKYASGMTLAPVGGYIEQDEDPLLAAQRELLEETGYVADEWIALGHYAVDANRGVGTGHLYLARQARHSAETHADDLEEQELIVLGRAELQAALHDGRFKILPHAAAIALALLYLAKS